MSTENLIDDIPLPGMPEPPLTLDRLMNIPAGIIQLPEQCWEAPGDDLTHYPDEQAALDASCEHVGPCDDHPRPRQFDHLCWTATAACGMTVGTEDFDVTHFPDPSMALRGAFNFEFTVVGGVLRCEDGDMCGAKP